ncbi:MAG TPA: hypothetical protein VGF99_15360 [Myxococcota bacterium]
MNRAPDLTHEQAHLGERAVVDADGDTALAADDAAFLAAHPAAAAARRIAAAAERRRSSSSSSSSSLLRRLLLIGAPTLAMAGALALVVSPKTPTTIDAPIVAVDDDAVRAKGGAPVLVIQRLGSAGAVTVADGDDVAPGDLLQLGWVSTSSASLRGVVVSIDGRGTVTRHLPLAGNDAVMLGNKGAVPTSYELDDAPRFERFFLVSGVDVDVVAVVDAVTRLARTPQAMQGTLMLPNARWSVASIVVNKKAVTP